MSGCQKKKNISSLEKQIWKNRNTLGSSCGVFIENYEKFSLPPSTLPPLSFFGLFFSISHISLSLFSCGLHLLISITPMDFCPEGGGYPHNYYALEQPPPFWTLFPPIYIPSLTLSIIYLVFLPPSTPFPLPQCGQDRARTNIWIKRGIEFLPTPPSPPSIAVFRSLTLYWDQNDSHTHTHTPIGATTRPRKD